MFFVYFFFFFKQKTAYEMRISDWSSDVCSSDLSERGRRMSPRPDVGDRLREVGRRFYVACSAFRAVTRGKSRWRYSVGVDPKCLLNAALKEDLLLKPVSKAISSTHISCLARSMSTAAPFPTRYRSPTLLQSHPSVSVVAHEDTAC